MVFQRGDKVVIKALPPRHWYYSGQDLYGTVVRVNKNTVCVQTEDQTVTVSPTRLEKIQ